MISEQGGPQIKKKKGTIGVSKFGQLHSWPPARNCPYITTFSSLICESIRRDCTVVIESLGLEADTLRFMILPQTNELQNPE